MPVHTSLVVAVLFAVSALTVYGSLPGLAGGSIATVIGLTATIRGVTTVADWWRLSTTDSVPMQESVGLDEPVQIRGTVRPAQSSDTLTSPIQGHECVAYEYAISRQVQGTGDPSIDSGTDCTPFVISDGTAEIYVAPTTESLSLERETTGVTAEKELLEQVDEQRLDLEPSAHTGDSGLITNHIELMEGTIRVGDEVTVVGNANPAPEWEVGDADAVMTSDMDRLLIVHDESGTLALRTGARGLFLLVLGLTLAVLGGAVLVANMPVQ
jgi:hypothetical protein